MVKKKWAESEVTNITGWLGLYQCRTTVFSYPAANITSPCFTSPSAPSRLIPSLLLPLQVSAVSCWAEGCWTCPDPWSSPGHSPHAWWPEHWSSPPEGTRGTVKVLNLSLYCPLVVTFGRPEHRPTFTSSHSSLSSVKTREVWRGVGGTTMYCWRVEDSEPSVVWMTSERKKERRFTQSELTLIQGWFINWAMVILSLGSVFSNCTMSCFAVTSTKKIKKKKNSTQSLIQWILCSNKTCSPERIQRKCEGIQIKTKTDMLDEVFLFLLSYQKQALMFPLFISIVYHLLD